MTNKYGAKKGGGYDSKVERMVEQKYRLLEKSGLISCLRRNFHSFLIIPPIMEEYAEEIRLKTKVKQVVKRKVIEKAAHYKPDFLYFDCETNEYVALELKSFITKKEHSYPLRRKLFRWIIKRHNDSGKKPWRFEEIEV